MPSTEHGINRTLGADVSIIDMLLKISPIPLSEIYASSFTLENNDTRALLRVQSTVLAATGGILYIVVYVSSGGTSHIRAVYHTVEK